MASQTFLVTAATGNVGAPVVHKLLARGHKVHAVTSDRTSDRAKALEKAGAVVFQAEWKDEAGLNQAIQGCHGVFINPHPPKFEDFLNESAYAEVILRAAKAAGVQMVVLNSAAGTKDVTSWPEWDEFFKHSQIFSGYWLQKQAVLNSVTGSGLQWAVIAGSVYHSNWASPKTISESQKGMCKQPVGELRKMSSLETALHLIDPADIAEFCVMALTEPTRFAGKYIEIYGDRKTVGQIAESMTRVLDKPIRVSEDDTEMMPGLNRLNDILAARWQFGDLKPYGVQFRSHEEWLEANKNEIKAAMA